MRPSSIDLWPAIGIISCSFNAVHRFQPIRGFALEFTFDLLHRAVQWSIFGAGRKSVTYGSRMMIPWKHHLFIASALLLVLCTRNNMRQ